jgi:hypothetical protein
VPASGWVGQGASEDAVVVADSNDVTPSGDATTKLESEIAEKKMQEKCILVYGESMYSRR